MGWTPQQVDGASLWQFAAAVDGWNVANGGQPVMPPPPTEAEYYDLVERLG